MIYRSGRKRARVKRAALALFLIGIAMLGWLYHVAASDPIVRSIRSLATPILAACRRGSARCLGAAPDMLMIELRPALAGERNQ